MYLLGYKITNTMLYGGMGTLVAVVLVALLWYSFSGSGDNDLSFGGSGGDNLDQVLENFMDDSTMSDTTSLDSDDAPVTNMNDNVNQEPQESQPSTNGAVSSDNNQSQPQPQPTTGGNNGGNKTFVLYFAPYDQSSNELIPKWNNLKQKYEGSGVQMDSCDCQRDPQQAYEHGVEETPTIIAFVNGKRVKYGGDGSQESLEQFINYVK